MQNSSTGWPEEGIEGRRKALVRTESGRRRTAPIFTPGTESISAHIIHQAKLKSDISKLYLRRLGISYLAVFATQTRFEKLAGGSGAANMNRRPGNEGGSWGAWDWVGGVIGCERGLWCGWAGGGWVRVERRDRVAGWLWWLKLSYTPPSLPLPHLPTHPALPTFSTPPPDPPLSMTQSASPCPTTQNYRQCPVAAATVSHFPISCSTKFLHQRRACRAMQSKFVAGESIWPAMCHGRRQVRMSLVGRRRSGCLPTHTRSLLWIHFNHSGHVKLTWRWLSFVGHRGKFWRRPPKIQSDHQSGAWGFIGGPASEGRSMQIKPARIFVPYSIYQFWHFTSEDTIQILLPAAADEKWMASAVGERSGARCGFVSSHTGEISSHKNCSHQRKRLEHLP